ncbi:hypothetical protein MAM1_0043d03026 [Mucor ambiguus]|uniref:Uncharacterized protein n=1 Tax=Mucor ambiguus TaxID=91626 RepID=A0A0C9M3J0_9FUNG|nr:hypothetical protein MAM1_0043d03026 [Mucor ambiguus]
MAGHVTYACQCLNVKIHLANKYYLEGHEKFRRDKFTRLKEPPIEGWKFELSMDGVTVEYASLICLRIIMDNPKGWVTVSCHNCSTGDVYSVKRPNTKIAYPFDNSLLSKFGDQVIIHKGTIFGSEIDKLKKKATYSSTFHIVLNPDLPITHASQEDEDDTYGFGLKKEHKHVQQLLRQSLIDLEEITEKRIQEFQREQEMLLVREKEKAAYDSAILWQRMKEIAKTVQEEEQRVRRLALQKTKNGVTDQILFNRIMSEEEKDGVIKDTALDATETEMKRRESHVHFAQSNSYEPASGTTIEQRRRSSAFKRDLFGGFGAPIHHSRRRSSHVLDESAIANSFKNAYPLEPVPEMPQLHRRRSSLVSSQQHHHRRNLHPLAVANHHVHPLAPPCSNASSLWEDDQENASKADDDSSEEELFSLDEDMQDPDEYSPLQSRKLSSKRRPSSKYIEFEEEEEKHDKEGYGQQPTPRKHADKANSHDEQQDHSFATSVPITIHHPPAFPVKNKTEDMQTSVQKKHPSSSFIQRPTYLNPARDRRPSFVGFDYAEADRRASLNFPPLDLKRNSVHHAMPTSYQKDDHTQQQHLSSNKNKIELELEEEDDTEQDQNGPMIPPHILAAHAVADETEALFGSMPRNSTRHRPLE